MGNRILVIGCGGKTGKRVFKKLQDLKQDAVPASRSSAIPFDWYNQSTWEAALAGIDKVYICFQPDIAIPQALDIITHFVSAAKSAGVKKLVLLSGRGEPEALACEQAVANSGVAYTIITCAFFMQNFCEGFLADGINNGTFVIPKVKAKEPFVDADDIADMAVQALLGDEHNGKRYELTGSELLSFGDAVGRISRGIGKPVEFIEVELQEYASILRSHQVPEDVTALITYLFGEVLDGRNESVHNDIEEVLGRKATPFDTYVAKTVSTGIWNFQKDIV